MTDSSTYQWYPDPESWSRSRGTPRNLDLHSLWCHGGWPRWGWRHKPRHGGTCWQTQSLCVVHLYRTKPIRWQCCQPWREDGQPQRVAPERTCWRQRTHRLASTPCRATYLQPLRGPLHEPPLGRRVYLHRYGRPQHLGRPFVRWCRPWMPVRVRVWGRRGLLVRGHRCRTRLL